MIPALITRAHILEALRCIDRKGIPSRRRSRGYCLVKDGKHVPPKYTLALAHQVATGEFLSSDQFSGGSECNKFLGRRGFEVVECNCGGSVHDGRRPSMSSSSERREPTDVRTRHSERCPECKKRVREMLEHIYGTCLPNHGFPWQTDLASYAGTPIETALRKVATGLRTFRGFGTSDFVRRKILAPCDFWVPNPGFVVEFDESQHFTRPRRLALSAYSSQQPLGFCAKRWMRLCEHHDAKDNDPPYRDEQRAWYDTLRDLVPPIKGLQPTVRLYARDMAWCSLDPDNRADRERFSDLIHQGRSPTNRETKAISAAAIRAELTLHVAMLFPKTNQKSSNGVPPSEGGAQQPVVPTAAAFAGETVDCVLFPEGYIRASDRRRTRALQKLASDLSAPLLVGAIDNSVDSTPRVWQVLLRFDPNRSGPSRVYVKHSTAKAIAFERPDWEPRNVLPTFELNGVSAGATICHDSYLGLLPRFLARCGARLWVNPSFDNVTDIKWSSILRLRAVENRFFAMCTLHCDVTRRRTHPFAFGPDGNALSARKAGSEVLRPLSTCVEAGQIYVVDLDMAAAGGALDWSKLPPADKPKRPRNGQPRRPVRVALRGGQPSVLGSSGWKAVCTGFHVETDEGPVYVGVVPEERILDSALCLCVLDHAKQANAAPIIWNQWNQLPTESERLATLMMGRAIECCAPIVISDGDGICELVELSNRNKIPTRREMESSGEVIIDVGYAWGLDSAFRMVADHLPAGMAGFALDRYRSLR